MRLRRLKEHAVPILSALVTLMIWVSFSGLYSIAARSEKPELVLATAQTGASFLVAVATVSYVALTYEALKVQVNPRRSMRVAEEERAATELLGKVLIWGVEIGAEHQRLREGTGDLKPVALALSKSLAEMSRFATYQSLLVKPALSDAVMDLADATILGANSLQSQLSPFGISGDAGSTELDLHPVENALETLSELRRKLLQERLTYS